MFGVWAFVEIDLECVQDNVGVDLKVDEHDEVAVELVVGSVIEKVGAKDRAGKGVEFGNPSLLVEGRLGEYASCTICS